MVLKDYNYSSYAQYYDLIELNWDEVKALNNLLDKKLRKFKVKTILDMACGTGAQIFDLLKKRYKIIASDLNKDMLEIAKKKDKKKKIKFFQGDMRDLKVGKFDAIITMFNAIGHLNQDQFSKALENIKENLNNEGIYIFDIFNLDYMKKNFRTHKFIDVLKEHEGTKFVRFNDNKLDKKKGIMHINQKTWVQKNMKKPEIIEEKWDMKIYSVEDLINLLKKKGFEILEILDREGNKFDKNKSLFIFIIVKKNKIKWQL